MARRRELPCAAPGSQPQSRRCPPGAAYGENRRSTSRENRARFEAVKAEGPRLRRVPVGRSAAQVVMRTRGVLGSPRPSVSRSDAGGDKKWRGFWGLGRPRGEDPAG
jgi:hypothetical protein